MHQITWDEVTNIKDLKGITPNLTEKEWSILNDNIEFTEARRKAASVLRYLKKHILLNNGSWSKSFKTIWNMYKRYHNHISLSHLKNIIARLEELNLICINKDNKKNIYFLPLAEKMPEKLSEEKCGETIDNTSLNNDVKIPRYGSFDNNFNILDTNKENPNSLIKLLKKAYKGIKPSLVATKKQLREIVQATLVAKGLHGNNPFSRAIQYLVFKKIRYSQQDINLIGAVSYIEKVIEDRIKAYKENLIEVPSYVTGENTNIRFNDFENQRNYDYDKLEGALLGYNDVKLSDCYNKSNGNKEELFKLI